MTTMQFLSLLKKPEVILAIVAPLIAVAYSATEYWGFLDWCTGRDKALAGLRRLESAAGYPKSQIYSAGEDKPIFDALLKRLLPKLPPGAAKDARKLGVRPACFTVVGLPVPLEGIQPDWGQEARFYYTPNHPLSMGFASNAPVSAKDEMENAKLARVCTLGQLSQQLQEEKEARRFWVGTLMVGVLSVALIWTRYAVR